MLKKPCSPYDQIQPLAQKGSRFQPAQTLGKSWQMEVRPGGDVYYQPVGQKAPCWDKPFRPQAHSQVDKIALVDRGRFDLELKIDRTENVSKFQAWAELLVKSLHLSNATAEDMLGAFNSILDRAVKSHATDFVFLITLRCIEPTSGCKNLDRAVLNLYTKEKDSAEFSSHCTVRLIKSFLVECRASDFMKLIIGFSNFGYGEGGFGL